MTDHRAAVKAQAHLDSADAGLPDAADGDTFDPTTVALVDAVIGVGYALLSLREELRQRPYAVAAALDERRRP